MTKSDIRRSWDNACCIGTYDFCSVQCHPGEGWSSFDNNARISNKIYIWGRKDNRKFHCELHLPYNDEGFAKLLNILNALGVEVSDEL